MVRYYKRKKLPRKSPYQKTYSKKTGRPIYAEKMRIQNAARGPRNLDYLKPEKYKNYLTLKETAVAVPCDTSWLKTLERDGRIPRAARVQRGQLSVRLWSPEQVEEIRRIIDGHRIGRPRADADGG